MSDMDPFGNASSSRVFRSKNGGMSSRGPGAGMLGQLSHMAKDVGDHFTGKGKRWAQLGVYLGGANAVYGLMTLGFAFAAMRGHAVQWLAVLLGASRTASLTNVCVRHCSPMVQKNVNYFVMRSRALAPLLVNPSVMTIAPHDGVRASVLRAARACAKRKICARIKFVHCAKLQAI